MSTRPEHYSGRGAITSDLNHDILEGIWSGIKEHFGNEAAENFVQMVRGIRVISATTFLEELYMLAGKDWQYVSHEADTLGIAIAKDEDGNYNMASGLATVANMMSSSSRDETQAIKAWFLKRHGVPPRETVVDRYCNETKIW